MKQKILPFSIAIFSCVFMLSFSKITKNQNPGFFAYSFVSVDASTGKAKAKLETRTAIKQKAKGKASSAVTYSIEGVKSAVRLLNSDNVFDVITDMQTSSFNPILYIGFYKVTSGKTGRTLVIDPNNPVNSFGFNIASLDQNTSRLIVGGALQPGEYAFVDKTTTTSEGNMTVWLFGID